MNEKNFKNSVFNKLFNYKENENKENALKKAIKDCRERDILREFLEKYAAEVFNMMITDWNLKDAKEVWQEEAKEEGFAEGEARGIAAVFDLLDKGIPVEEAKKILETQKL